MLIPTFFEFENFFVSCDVAWILSNCGSKAEGFHAFEYSIIKWELYALASKKNEVVASSIECMFLVCLGIDINRNDKVELEGFYKGCAMCEEQCVLSSRIIITFHFMNQLQPSCFLFLDGCWCSRLLWCELPTNQPTNKLKKLHTIIAPLRLMGNLQFNLCPYISPPP